MDVASEQDLKNSCVRIYKYLRILVGMYLCDLVSALKSNSDILKKALTRFYEWYSLEVVVVMISKSVVNPETGTI